MGDDDSSFVLRKLCDFKIFLEHFQPLKDTIYQTVGKSHLQCDPLLKKMAHFQNLKVLLSLTDNGLFEIIRFLALKKTIVTCLYYSTAQF